MRNFRDLEVWKNGIKLVVEIYKILDCFPNSEKYGLTSQISRAVVSIPSNIAEACSRDSQKDFSRFLQIALGSAFELETQLLISKELKYIGGQEHAELLQQLIQLQKSINSLKKYADSKG